LYAFDLTSENSAGLDPTTSVSADGKTVLFWKQPRAGDPNEFAATVPIEGGRPETVKMPFPAGEVYSFKFHPDGKSILFLRHDENGVGNIWTVRHKSLISIHKESSASIYHRPISWSSLVAAESEMLCSSRT
jgi:hypothetical protein